MGGKGYPGDLKCLLPRLLTRPDIYLFLCLWGWVVFNPGTQGTVFPGLRVRMAVCLLSANGEREDAGENWEDRRASPEREGGNGSWRLREREQGGESLQ